MRYNTLSPLSSKSVDASNTVVIQPDLLLSLTSDNVEGKKNLFKGSFSTDMENTELTYIFVHVYRGKFNQNTGSLFLAINIIIPNSREQLKYSEDSRSIEIASRIEDLIDKIYVDNEYVEWLGNLKPELVSVDIGRLSNTNSFNLTTLLFEVDILTMRDQKNA